MQREPTEDTPDTEEPKKLNNACKAELRQEWVDELVSGCRTEADLFGPEGARQPYGPRCQPRGKRT